MKKYTFLISILLLAICFIACKKKNPQREETKKTITEWMGKTIVFPNDVSCTYLLQDNVTDDNCVTDKPFKIFLYVDSVGCTSCKLRLFDWKSVINDADTLLPGQVDFVFYFHPKNIKELTLLLKRDRFEYPIYLDLEDKINKLNDFPKNSNYHCFLLDADNRVLSIGNPLLNPNIWNLYKQVISGKIEPEKKNSNTIVTTDKYDIEISKLVVGMK
ncbi:hypothetical protein D0T49_05645 [Paludibacter sp. 221]|uniref:hypothetical protein n=1 Tax=Paludibacter sp. 221 TaxID=2302939 RepID=UPI0013D5352C|nr:hypothetical protein [Paludibacter sp. 221]NDV46525.1 hypothetical protein [Paludibacter sp. 221]